MIEVAIVGLGRVAPEFLRRPLEPRGYRVTALDDVAALRHHLSHTDVGLSALLVPHRLPGIDPADLITALKSEPRHREMSAIVVGVDARDRRRIGELGADGFLQVPFSDADVLKVLGASTRRRKLIILADDSEMIHRHTVPILKNAGYDVVSAYDGVEAVAKARQLRPQLVITDVEMPKLDGYGVCRAIKSDLDTAHIPVLMCSALGEAADLQRGFDAGTDSYLVKPVAPVEVTTAVHDLLAGGMPASRELILVVDDSAMARLVVSDCLARQGFKIQTAENGARGLDAARRVKPALIISDYEMPVLSGFEMVVELRREPETRDIPVVMLTARDSRRDQKQLEAAGATACLVKPFTPDKCVVTVERVLAERRLRAFKRGAETYFGRTAFEVVERRAAAGQIDEVRAERRTVSVLFSDICQFTTLAGNMEPMEVIKMLNEYFDVLCPLIREEGGDIDKFIGDAIMAVFEEKKELESCAVRAVRAALAMQAAMKNFQTWRDPRLRTRIGINTGTVVRGDLGSKERREITVIGDAVNRANRYESAAPIGGVLVSESTYAHLHEETEAERRPGIELKGVAETVTGWLIHSMPLGAR